MSNEISVTTKLTVAHGGGTFTVDATKQWDIATDGKKFGNIQGLTTSAEDIAIGDMTWSETIVLAVKNQSTVAGEEVLVFKSGGTETIKIPPGATEIIYPKPDGTALQAKSASGTPSIQVLAAKRA